MQFEIDKHSAALAKSPHELFVINVLVFHLLTVVISLSINNLMLALWLPPLFTLICLGISLLQMNRYRHSKQWFVAAHWQLSIHRYLILLIAYLISLLIMVLAWLLTHSEGAANTADILFTALSRIAIMPTLLCLMVLAVIEAGAMFQAMKGELPKRLAKKFRIEE